MRFARNLTSYGPLPQNRHYYLLVLTHLTDLLPFSFENISYITPIPLSTTCSAGIADWIWTNQYDNPANVRAHLESTGPEIWEQTGGDIDYLVCSVGSGGTVCGIGLFMKKMSSRVQIIAVEPDGSTVFGGVPGSYLSVGAGMRGPSGLVKRHGHVIDYYCKVCDEDSLQECVNFLVDEGIDLGVTSGSVLVVANYLAKRCPTKNIVAICADGGERYSEFLEGLSSRRRQIELDIRKYESS